MNFYEHHIGDYDKNTAHLSACEDGIYCRLLRRYYDKEAPLEADVEKIKRWARARAKDERDAVDAILGEFFRLEADGWHHDKADAAIAAYQAGAPAREQKKINELTRLDKHRQERSELFAELNAAGQHLPWNVHMNDLRAAVARIRDGVPAEPATLPVEPATRPATKAATPATAPATPATPPATQPATAPATPATATQSPLPTTHYPVDKVRGGSAPPPAPKPPAPKATKAPAKGEPAPTAATWEAYARAYEDRYGCGPVRNATVNGVISQFVARVGAEHAPHVAAFYVRSNRSFYVSSHHAVQPMLKDAEQLFMLWQTNREAASGQPVVTDRQKRAAAALAPLMGGRRSAPDVLDLEEDGNVRIR